MRFDFEFLEFDVEQNFGVTLSRLALDQDGTGYSDVCWRPSPGRKVAADLPICFRSHGCQFGMVRNDPRAVADFRRLVLCRKSCFSKGLRIDRGALAHRLHSSDGKPCAAASFWRSGRLSHRK